MPNRDILRVFHSMSAQERNNFVALFRLSGVPNDSNWQEAALRSSAQLKRALLDHDNRKAPALN